MGILLKVILFGLVIYYILRTVGGFVIRILGGSQQHSSQNRNQTNARREGEINIDYAPNKDRKGRSRQASKDGDYIDYEEVK